jgi:hypothetical protein
MTINYPSYPDNYRPLANTAVDQNWRGNPMSMFAKGGRANTKPICVKVPRAPGYAKGGLHDEAKKVRDAGVGGDELIIHINRKEYDELVKHWGEPTINPHTGMPQFTPFYKQKWFAPVAALASAALMATGIGAPIGASLLGAVGLEGAAAGSVLGASVPSILGNAVIGGATGAVTGGGLKGGLTGAALGGLGTIGAGALGMTGPGVTGTGEGGFSGWYNSLGSGAAAAGDVRAPHPLDAPRTDVVGPLGPQLPAGASTAGSGLLSSLGGAKTLIPAALLGATVLGNMGGNKDTGAASTQSQASVDPNMERRLVAMPLTRQNLGFSGNDYYTYGTRSENKYYAGNVIPETKEEEDKPSTVTAARGGQMPAPGGPLSQTGRYVAGPGTGRSDSIDAKLSDGEYVIDAETVALLGDGSSKAGAKRLDQFRANIRKQKGRALAKGAFSPDAKRPEHYLMGGRA